MNSLSRLIQASENLSMITVTVVYPCGVWHICVEVCGDCWGFSTSRGSKKPHRSWFGVLDWEQIDKIVQRAWRHY